MTFIPFYLVAKLQNKGYECSPPQHPLQTNVGGSSLGLLVAGWRDLPLPEHQLSSHGCGFHPEAKLCEVGVVTVTLFR